jgi:hypothetical protein
MDTEVGKVASDRALVAALQVQLYHQLPSLCVLHRLRAAIYSHCVLRKAHASAYGSRLPGRHQQFGHG